MKFRVGQLLTDKNTDSESTKKRLWKVRAAAGEWYQLEFLKTGVLKSYHDDYAEHLFKDAIQEEFERDLEEIITEE